MKRNFDGPYVSLIQVGVIFIVFLAMIIGSNYKLDRAETVRAAAVAELEEIRDVAIPELEQRIWKVKARLVLREMQLQNQYANMLERPPEWPETLLVMRDTDE